LKVEALVRHADRDVPDPGPGVEPHAQRPERAIIGQTIKPGETDGCSQEPAALVEHGYSITWFA
jgi:hypothetical protein